MGSRLHGNDGGGLGSRGWVPRIEYGAGSVVTGTTVVGGWFPYAAPGRAGFKPAPTGAVAVKYAPTRGKRAGSFMGTTHAGCDRHTKGMKMASSVGMVEADPAPGPSGLGTT